MTWSLAMEQARRNKCLLSATLALVIATSCSQKPAAVDARPAQSAQEQFDQINREVHQPAAAARGAERVRLQNEAAARFAELVQRHPTQSNICAQALLSIGHIRAAQTNVDAAVRDLAAVGERYPTREWEVLQAWKSAADLLWETGRTNEARRFYSNVVARFDVTNTPAIYQAVVRGSKARLAR